MRTRAIIAGSFLCLASVVVFLSRNTVLSYDVLPFDDQLSITRIIIGICVLCIGVLALSVGRQPKRPVAILQVLIFLTTTANLTTNIVTLTRLRDDRSFGQGSIPVSWRKTVSAREIDSLYGNWEPWLKLKAQMQPEDQLWFYTTPKRYWDNLRGREGYVIERQGKIVASMRTKVS